MKSEAVKLLFPLLNSEVTGQRPNWILGRCPLGPWNHGGVDEHPSFGIRTSGNTSICKCFSCGFGGDLLDLTMKIGELDPDGIEKGYDLEKAVQLISTEFDEADLSFSDVPDFNDTGQAAHLDHIFPEQWLKSFGSVLQSKDARFYLKARGFTKDMVRRFDIRFDTSQYRVCFPYRNQAGHLVGLQGRAIMPDESLRYRQYKYSGKLNQHAWFGEDSVDFDKPVVLAEGPFDVASISRVYPNVIGAFTTGLSTEKLKRIGDASSIITFFDYGKGGDAARKRIGAYYSTIAVTHVIPSEHDGDPGDMTKSSIGECLQEHVNLL